MTVYDNIAFGLDVKKWKKADIRRRVDELVELVGLKGFAFFQPFFYFRLRLAENVLDDGFAGFRIVTDCVPTLPASILALSDVPFPVCSSFWHKISLLCNGKPYRKQQRKATGKQNCYQKVIICA